MSFHQAVMEPVASARVRQFWRRVHLWVALSFGVLLVPIGLSGAALVFSVDIDRLLDPARYAVTGAAMEQTASVYLENAASAAPGAQAAMLRWAAEPGAPIVVVLRGGGEGRSQTSGPMGRFRLAYLDPPSGRVLGVADPRKSLVGFIHSLHADLMAAEFSGREIVGFVGLGLLILTLTGVWLWIPRDKRIIRGLRWRRGAKLSFNLHHMAGVWLAGPLAVMALTGASLSFPQQTRSLIATFAELGPRPTRPGAAALMRRPELDPQRVLELALGAEPGARPTALSTPSEQDKVWRVQLLNANDESRSVLVDDRTSAVKVVPSSAGDAFAAWLRRVHEATHHGPVWRAFGVACGLGPAIFLVTGILMWLRRSGANRRTALEDASKQKKLAPSEVSPVAFGDSQTSQHL